MFTVSGTSTVPPLCSTLTGEHGNLPSLFFRLLIKNVQYLKFMFIITVYFDTEDNCHSLDFSFGQAANGNSKPTSRNFDIKVCI